MLRNRMAWAFVCVGLSITPTGLRAELPSHSEPLTEIAAAPAVSLVTLVEQVLSNHPQVQAARAALEAARARTRAAGKPLFNPELELDAEHAVDQTTFLGLSQTIDWADKRSAPSRQWPTSSGPLAQRSRVLARRSLWRSSRRSATTTPQSLGRLLASNASS